ncbi:MAG: sugar transferase [Candidatus Kapabacteria bacterium]|nr:sugar transferase [Candidatus Kapabacteria bacterium]
METLHIAEQNADLRSEITASVPFKDSRRNSVFGMWKSKYSPVVFQAGADILAIVCSAIVFYFWKLSSPDANPIVKTPEFIVTVLATLIVFWLGVFWLSGLYKNWYIRSPFDEFFTVAKSMFITGTMLTVAFLMESGYIRVKLLFFIMLMFVVVCTMRFIARKVQRYLRITKRITLPTVIVGTYAKALELYRHGVYDAAWGYDVRGVVLDRKEQQSWSEAAPLLGAIEQFEHVIESVMPSVVLVGLDSADHDTMLRIASQANDRGISVKILPDLYEIVTGQVKTLQIYGSQLIEVNPELLKPWEEAMKRTMDILMSIAVLVLGLPFWLLIMLIIRLESRGNPLYSQPRVGRNGHVFRIYKFRSMVQDAEKHGRQWTKVGDPRVTRFGYFLRKTHLDEIPQFWNILIGEMSIVGPRPEQPNFVEKFNAQFPYYNRRHRVRPGLTGWWQIKYTTYSESMSEIEARLRYDFFYIENMSIKLDIEIIFRTVFTVLRGHGQA